MIQAERIPLLRGEGRFVDDIRLPDMLHMACARSPHARARIIALDVEAARRAPGVIAVFTGHDVRDHIQPIRAQLEPGGTDRYQFTDWHPLAIDEVRYVGEIVATIFATDRYRAEDAAELVVVDYEPLPAVSDVYAARLDSAPQVHQQLAGNVLFHTHRTAYGHSDDQSDGEDEGDPFDTAAVRVQVSLRHPRVAGMSLEGAAALAAFNPATDELELFTSTQTPHLIRDGLSLCLGIEDNLLRVIAPDVGGGFGPKAQLFPEEILVAHAARTLARPVKWVQDRTEHLLACFHARDVRVQAELATDSDGIIVALRATALCDVGAYSSFPFTCALEPQTIGAALTGPYRVPWYDYEGFAIATNKYPTGAYRGVGFPLCALVTETLLDRVAAAIGVDPVVVRKRNLILPHELPRRNPAGALYDSGDYPKLLDMALERVDYDSLRRQQKAGATSHLRIGIGISCFIEFSAMNRMVFRLRGMSHIPGFDSALIRVTRSGGIEAYVSTPSQGQSQRTTFGRILADSLEIDQRDVRIMLGDTRLTPYGSGTFASRSLVSGGGALLTAARKLRERMCELAGLLWQIDASEVVFSAGAVQRRGDAQQCLSLAQIGAIVHSARHEFPAGWEAGLETRASYDPPSVPVSCASHVAVAQVDTRTGAVQLVRYVVAEDCGPVVDEAVVEGQVRGAIAQAIGAALLEEVHYDDGGQLLTGTLQDYLVPGVFDVPRIDIVHMYTPSPFTEGGYKGVAEGGTIGAPAAIVNAVADALGVCPAEVRMPLTRERVLAWAAQANT